MHLEALRAEIMEMLGTTPGEAHTEAGIHDALVAAGRSVSIEEVRKVFVSLVIEGRVDFLRGDRERRYVLVPEAERET